LSKNICDWVMLKHSGSTIDRLKIFVKRGSFSPMKNKMPSNRRARWQNNSLTYGSSRFVSILIQFWKLFDFW